MPQSNARIKNSVCSGPVRIVDGGCNHTPSPRITSSYCPGVGDKGISSLEAGRKSSKVCPSSDIYSAAESLIVALSELRIYNNPLSSIASRFYLKPISFALQLIGVKAIKQPEVIEVIRWLEQGLFSLQSYVYCLGKSSRHAWPLEFYNYINDKTLQWKDDAYSLEFQCFSTHRNLILLNKVRVHIRQLEIAYVRWYESLDLRLYTDKQIEVLQLHSKTINRLSSFFWCAIQRERKNLNLDPSYWCGYAPAFNPKTK